MSDKLFCVANWKMYLDNEQSVDYFDEFYKMNINERGNTEIIFCPSYPSLSLIHSYDSSKKISFGAQNISSYKKGPYTGEVSIQNLEKLGCNWVILGHSERRSIFNESNEMINKKMEIVCNSSISPILCIGENLDEMNNGQTAIVLTRQIKSAFKGIHINNNKTILLAYEPVWSIGTGVAANLDTIYTNIMLIKNIIKNNQINCNIYTLYGGSVNEINAKSIIDLDGIDGFLIGSSSIKPDLFHRIYKKIDEH